MKKWFRVKVAFGPYRKGDFICPEGLNREGMQWRGWITRGPVYVGASKPSAEEVDAFAAHALAQTTPSTNVTPSPATAPDPEPETPEQVTPFPAALEGSGAPRAEASEDETDEAPPAVGPDQETRRRGRPRKDRT